MATLVKENPIRARVREQMGQELGQHPEELSIELGRMQAALPDERRAVLADWLERAVELSKDIRPKLEHITNELAEPASLEKLSAEEHYRYSGARGWLTSLARLDREIQETKDQLSTLLPDSFIRRRDAVLRGQRALADLRSPELGPEIAAASQTIAELLQATRRELERAIGDGAGWDELERLGEARTISAAPAVVDKPRGRRSR